jgi:outer membrane lipoprotein-sorting protein
MRFGELFFSSVFIVAFSAYCDTTNTSSPLLSLLRKNYSPDIPLSTKFTLAIYWSVREKEEKKKGSICLSPGDKFRITAGGETFVSDGATFWHYSAGSNQVIIRKLADVDRSTLPSQIFTRYVAALPFREAERKKGAVRFVWKSDTGGEQYKEIQVTVQEADRRITRCVLTDNNGNRFTYVFTATVFGERIPRERFAFNVPKNARVVDMRQ